MIRLFILLMLVSSVSFAKTIAISFTPPTLLEDGSPIVVIDKYNLYHSIDNINQPVIEIQSTETGVNIDNVVIGIHSFKISTLSNGLEGEVSDTISVNIEAKPQSKPVKILLTVQIIEN